MKVYGDDKRFTIQSTKGYCQLNVNVTFITQNLFQKEKEIRSSSLNSQYLILFKNRHDQSQIMHLGRQLCTDRTELFEEGFDDATKESSAYLLSDLRNETDTNMCFPTQISICVSTEIQISTRYFLKFTLKHEVNKQHRRNLELIKTCP